MSTRRRYVILVLLCASLTISTLYIVTSHQLSWGIEEGSTLTYAVEASGWYDEWYPGDEHGVPNLALALDGLLIDVNITALPDLPSILIPVSQFMSHSRPNCTSYFENGTLIPEFYSGVLTDLMSYAITPLSNWGLLDILFAESYSNRISEYSGEYVITRFEDDLFYIMYVHEISGGMHRGLRTYETKVNMTSGIPVYAKYHYDYDLSSATYEINIELFLL